MKRFFAILMAFFLVIAGLPIQSSYAAAYDPVTKTEGDATLDLRFWEDQKPDVGFYLNAGNRFLLETVTEPWFGTSAGEWSVMDILRGYYTGYDYLNYVPENYYDDYIKRVEGYVIAKKGELDRSKSTEWSRSTLSFSALGKDIRSVGEPGDYLNVKFVTMYQGEKEVNTSNSLNYFTIKLEGDKVVLDKEYGLEFNYVSEKNGGNATGFAIVPAGTYTIDRTNMQLRNDKNEVVSVPYTEMSYGKAVTTHTVDTLAAASILTLEKPYDYVEKLSKQYSFTYKQGINGPIWILIAMDTGGYELYTKEQLAERGISVTDATITTKGKLIDYILGKEITSATGRVGGWALTGKNADPDITMMAVQALAPYYLDEQKFKNAYRTTIDAATKAYFDVDSDSFKEKYTAFKKAVERAVYVMAEDQKPNGGFASFGTINSESIVQVIVGLTALGIDPLSNSVHLPTIDQTVSFIKEGSEQDGVWSNNMIDALISFWAMGSGSSSEVSGFKHVTTGDDGGGGAGTIVNGMATDQAIYGLIAYDRFLKKEKRLYDMTDMINGEYKTMEAKSHTYTYMSGDTVVEQGTFSPYAVLTIPEPPAKEGYNAFWTTEQDGTGTVYTAGERLSTPDHAITLYAQYAIPYDISYELNEGTWIQENAAVYEPATRTLTLPTAAHVQKENHVFDGWYTNADFQGEALKTLQDPTQLQHAFFAKWVSYETLIANVNSAIAALPAAEEFTLAHEEALIKAQSLFQQVPASIIEQVKNAEKLVPLQDMLYVLKATEAIHAIPVEQQLTSADRATIEKAREAINLVPESIVEKVVNSQLLTRAEDVLKIRIVEETIATLPEQLNLTHIAFIEQLTAAIHALPGSLQVEVHNMAIYKEKLAIIQQLQQQATDIDYANDVRNLINALPNVVTLEHVEQVLQALAAYEKLSENQKDLISTESAKLHEIQQQVNALLQKQELEQLQAQIAALPEISSLTLAHKDAVLQAYEAYLALPYEQKQAIDSRPLNLIVAAFIELQIDALANVTSEADKPALNEVRYLYAEADFTIQTLVTNYYKLEQAYSNIENFPKVQKANEVMAKINLIPATITTTAKTTIEAARAAYEALQQNEKDFVTNYYKLTQAESALASAETATQYSVDQLNQQIKQLPLTITLEYKQIVIALLNSYNSLSLEAKGRVTNYSILAQALQTISTLETQKNQSVQVMQAAITSLPDAASITIAHKGIIEDVRLKFNSLTATQQAQINNTKLIAAEAQLLKLTQSVQQIEQDRLVIYPITNGFEKIATISPASLQSVTVPTVEIKTSEGISITFPKNVLMSFSNPIQVSTSVDYTGSERSIDIKLGTLDGAAQKAHRLNTPFTIRIPVSAFMSPQASTNTVTFEPGVILGYSTEKGYYAVPHIYENGEFIVTVSEGHKLVHRTDQITFDDIQGSIFQEEIEYLASRFVIKGYDNATFRPDEKITRGQFAALISRALDLKPSKPTTFSDAFLSSFRDDIQAVYESGIMRGYADTKFGVNDPLTREQAAATMARVLEYMDYEAKRNLVYFKDKNDINPEFIKQIELLNTLDIMSGYGDGLFKPKDYLTRGQLAKILQRTLKLTNVM